MNAWRFGCVFLLLAAVGCGRTSPKPSLGSSAQEHSEQGPAPKVTGDPPADREQRARAFVNALAKGDFQAAAKDFDAEMIRAFPDDALEKFWKNLIAKTGPFERQGAAKQLKVDKYDVVVVTCAFAKVAMNVRVVYDPDGKIGGFFVDLGPPPYAKPDAFRETDVTVTTGEWSLPGTLTLPTGDGPFPAAVLLHGSGPQDRDGTLGFNAPNSKSVQPVLKGFPSLATRTILRYGWIINYDTAIKNFDAWNQRFQQEIVPLFGG